MHVTRRDFIGWSAVGLGGAAFLRGGSLRAAGAARFKVGVTDWNLRQEGKVAAVALAKEIGFDGVQVSIGVGTDKLPLSDPALQKAYLDESKRVLLPFFGKGALTTAAEMDYVGDLLKEIAPAAQKAGVILGLEDTISAKDNVRIMERTKSPAVLTYYDVGNSTKGGFNVIEEIRWLGKDRICEVHQKDNPHYLGEGTIDFPGVVAALADIGFAEWAELETDCPTKVVTADMGRNLKYIRGLMMARAHNG